MVCYQPKGYVWGDCLHGVGGWIPLGCRNCEGCKEWWRKRTMRRILNYLEGQKWVSFVTLTSLPGAEWPSLVKQFGHLVRWLRSTYGVAEYVAVKEKGSVNGMKHLHCIFSPWIWVPYAALSQKWFALSGAWAVNIQRVASSSNLRRVASYVAKYITKGFATESYSQLRKRVTFSRGWPKLAAPLMKPWLRLEWQPHFPWLRGGRKTSSGCLVQWDGSTLPCDCFGQMLDYPHAPVHNHSPP